MRRIAFVALAVCLAGVVGWTQGNGGQAVFNRASAAKFAAAPGLPECTTFTVEHGDLTNGPSVLLAKTTPACVIPWHWHTPNETVYLVSGTLELQMRGEKPAFAHRGDFAWMPSHQAHQARCTGPAPCTFFIESDAAFDIHYVDQGGNEIPLEEALKAAEKTTAKAARSSQR